MGLIHWWSFNNTVDDNGSRPKAMIPENSPTFQTGGKTASYSARYSGGSDHYINNDIQNCDELSMACWVKLDTSQSTWGQLFSINTWGTNWTNIMMGFDNSPNVAVYFTITDGTNYVGYDMPSNSNLQDGKWHHLAGTYKWDGSKSTLRFYVDGVEQSCSPHTVTYKPAFSSARYISTGEDAGEYINGNMNDARIYDHCLSDLEVKNLAKALMLHYNFEDLYTPLDYIEANGTQWIQTGLTYADFSSTKTIRCEMAITTSANTTSKQYSTWIGCQQNLQYLLRLDYGKLLYYAGGSVSYPTTLANNTKYTIEFVSNYNMNSSVCKVNGTTYSSTAPNWGSNSVGIMLFASHNGGAPWTSELGEGKLHYCRFYNRDVLVRDFIPVLRQSDGKAGLYDRVNNVFYPNNGTGEFSYNECFPAVNYQNASISGNTVTFSKSSDGWGNSGILAKEPVNKGFVSATVAQNNRYIMIGFAPVNNSYNYTQGYFIYPSNNATYNIYELGAHIGNFGSYNANDVFRVIYDGSVIRYYKNDSLVREVSASGKMYMNITNYNAASATIKDVSFGPLEFIKDCSGNENFATLRTPSAFSVTTDTKLGEYALRNVSGNPSAVIDTRLNPSGIAGTGTICFWYKKDSSAFNYNSGHFLVATQRTSGNFFAATQSGTPFCSGCSYSTFYLDCVANANSNVQDTNWHFYVFTGVNLSAWSALSLHSHGDASWLYRGNIADFKIFNTNLSLADIKDLYETKMKIDRNGNVYCEKLVKSYGNLQFPTDRGLIKANGVMYSNQAQISALYDELEYIQSTGSQAINTGYLIDTNSSWSVTFALTSTANGQIIAGTWNNGTAVSQLTTYQNTVAIQHLATDTVTGMGQITTNTNKHTIHLSQDIQTADGVGVSRSSIAGTASNPIYIGSRGGAGGYCNARFYGCRIWQNNNLVRDFVPVRRKTDNIVGMLDKVNGVFYTNSGSGSFTAGTSLGTCYLIGAKNLYEGMGVSVNPNTTKK